MSFVHLHLHSQYSLLDGYIEFERLLEHLKTLEMPAAALTDHGNMFGAIEFYSKMNKAGIRPILGCELYYTTGDRRNHSREGGKTHHLLVLARNHEGYVNLCQLVSQAYFEGFYYKPRVDWELLTRHSGGLIATSSCLRGEIPTLLLAGMHGEAERRTVAMQELFGDNFFIELQDHGLDEQRALNPLLIELAQRRSAPLVATNDCHYIRRDDARVHDVLLCIQSGKTLDDPQRLRFRNDEFYVKSAAEMQERFATYPAEALSNTLEIAKRVDLHFKFGNYLFPSFKTPGGESLDDYFEVEARRGFEQRLPHILKTYEKDGEPVEDVENLRRRYTERLESELTIIKRMGFSGYFLIVADFIAFAKDRGIPVGPGRGSAAGSLVAYALRITDVDPLPYKLLFERFLNPERISMPDIDIDFCVRGRDEVIRYVAGKYGEAAQSILSARVAQIITFGKMKARAVIRDVGRALNMPYGEVDRIAKLVPFSINITLKEAFSQEPKFDELRAASRQVNELLNVAEALEGFVRHASTHAAGVVISDDRALTEHMPLFQGSEGEVTTQYDMKVVEDLGLIKFDFLGLKTLTVIRRATELIRESHGIELVIEELALDDPEVYHLLSRGDTTGIFQLESSGMRDLITRLKPGAFEEIIALVALYRPGPLGSGMVDDFIKRKHGLTPIQYELPALEDILNETYGVILYQEQVMQIAVKLAGYSMADADLLRKAMGKKIAEVMLQQKERFMRGALANNVHPGKAERIFDLMVAFGGYGFNKSHSTAYALIAYQTAYLKAHYPVEFMTALLSEDLGNTDKVISYITDCNSMQIQVLPPDVNISRFDFEAVAGRIRFGLGAVKGIGAAAIEAIVEARERGGPFKDAVDCARRVDFGRVNRKVFEALIKCGALDCGGVARSRMFAALDRILELGQSYQQRQQSGQFGMFDVDGSVPSGFFPSIDEWEEKVKLNFEREAVGFYLSGHPLNKFKPVMQRLRCLAVESLHAVTESDSEQRRSALVAAVVTNIKEITTKRGDRMAFVTLEDLSGTVEGVVFANTYAETRELLRSDEPLCVRGTIDCGEEKNKFLVNRVALLVEAEDVLATQVHLRIIKPRLSEERLAAVKQTLTRHPGRCATFLHLKLEDQRIVTLALPEDQWVKPGEELLRDLHIAIGDPEAMIVEIQ